MLRKTNLAYLAEDHGIIDYDDFSDYVFANFPSEVWRVHDGIEYCYPECAMRLAKEYLEYRSLVSRYQEVSL
jgi:hypothetical protein